MRRSEVFESFVKIAEEKGLISKGSPESVKKTLEQTGHADSLSIDDISKLYGVKPDAPKGSQYTRNIVEVAHPSPLVIAPSYDKLNGLVENINERQDILLHIVNKNNDGQITQRKYAERNLLMSLVRIGNDMDNRKQSDLVTLADICLTQASSKSLKKEGQWQVALVVAALIGALYAKQHLRFHSDGFNADYQKAIAELDDLLNSNSNWGVGYEYTPDFINQVNDIKNKLNEMNTEVQKILPILDQLQTPHTGSEVMAMAKDPKNINVVHALQEFQQKIVQELYPYLQKVISDFTNEGYKQRQIANKGFLSQMVDSTEVLHGGKGLVADDFDDVAHALQTLFSDVSGIVKDLQAASSIAYKAQGELTSAMQSAPSAEGESAQVETPTASNAPSPQAQKAPWETEEGDISTLTQLLGGGR